MGDTADGRVRDIFLGLDTSGFQTGLALVSGGAVLYETRSSAGTSHNESLLLLIRRALDAAGLQLDQLRGICLTIGPGMWTGLRVGLSTVKGLALPKGIAVKGVNTLRVIAATAGAGGGAVLAVMDARRNELYAALYHGTRVLIPPQAGASPFLGRLVAERQPPGDLLLAGDGSELIKPVLSAMGIRFVDSGVRLPEPAVIVRLGVELLKSEGPDRLSELEPVYLRRTDAEINLEGRLKGGL
uniref:tRNA (Adenosine(37)-N6)-threonylcarbamoyltransferase complex dimerization subunit type 1 TsaB n=1 Tax=candidate division WOR-3 bacterium TaxID=2052148 RepID=A0A7C3EMA9_UNCW3